MSKYRLKVLDENNETVDYVDFIDNLTMPRAEPYINFNGHVGLARLDEQSNNKGMLVIMYFYPEDQSRSYAEFISEEYAYEMCAHRNKLELAQQLDIRAKKKEVEVI